jgi:peptide/nickel transport system substrate-binding protein
MKKLILIVIPLLLLISLLQLSCSSQSSPTINLPASSPAPKASTSAAVSPSATAATTLPPASTPPAASKPATTAAAGPQQYGGTLRIIVANSPVYLGDPALIQDGGSQVISCLQALVFSQNNGQMDGVLATGWNIAPDYKSITFNLRKGVKFHDGTDFNATAAKWNLDRYLAAYAKSNAQQWDSIQIVDDYTVKLNLKSFQNTILSNLEGTASLMISPAAAQKNGIDWLKNNPVGTGSYQFKSFSRDVSMEFTRFDNYWGGKPYLDGIKYLVVADANTARMTFESGQADVFSSNIDSATADLIKKGYVLEKRPGPFMNLIPDSKNPNSPFADVKVRQAIAYAVDRQGMADTLGYGLWEVVNQPAAAYQYGHVDDSPYKYNLDKAKQLMKESKSPNGFKTTIITSSTFSKDPLLAIQANLSAIGITAEIKTVEFSGWNDYVNKGWDNALLWGTQGATDTNYVAFLDRYYGATATRYPVLLKPTPATDLITKALATPDLATAKTLSQQAVEILLSDCTAMPIYIQSACYLLTKNVHDTNFGNVGGSGLRWSAEKAWLSK